MEPSAKQKNASRNNGALGGVKTPEGKAVASRNAIKFGILANCATKYDSVDVEAIYAELAKELGDSTPSRSFLIQQLALLVLRLARCARAETELLRETLNPHIVEVRGPLDFDMGPSKVVVIKEGEPAAISSEALEKFALIYERYEPKLVSRFLRILRYLNEAA